MHRHQLETLIKAEHTAQHWLRTVADRLRTPDLDYAYRLLRAWLHTMRDQLPIGQSMRLAAALPELLRGIYYEGWEPDSVPIKHDAESFIAHFAREARISMFEVWHGAPVVSAALHSLLPPGHLEQAFAALPPQVRALVEPVGGMRRPGFAGSSQRETQHSAGRAIPAPRPWSTENPVHHKPQAGA
jgi:uncharacterized protein (DUF2267 family)